MGLLKESAPVSSNLHPKTFGRSAFCRTFAYKDKSVLEPCCSFHPCAEAGINGKAQLLGDEIVKSHAGRPEQSTKRRATQTQTRFKGILHESP